MKEYVADIKTLIGAEKYEALDGKAKGVELLRVYNGKIQLIIALSRGMDIFRLDYEGATLSFISKNGLVNPCLYSSGVDFLNCFGGGFLYTCGLDNIGGAREVNGGNVVQHGSYSYLPAENVTYGVAEKDGKYSVVVEGDVCYTALFGAKLTLHRKITLEYLSSELVLEDTVTNNAFVPAKYELMHHCNLGYPLIDEATRIYCDTVKKTDFVNAKAEGNKDRMFEMEAPTAGREEEVFAHTFTGLKNEIAIKGQRYGVTFKTENFAHFMEWKSMASGDYVLGVEPATTILCDRDFTSIEAGESHSYKITFAFEKM